MYDLFPDGTGGQILCKIHPRGLCVPSDGIRVSFCYIEGQRNGFCAIRFFLQYGTSIAIKWVRASARKGDAEGSSRPPTGGREQSKAMLAPSSRREILLSAVNSAFFPNCDRKCPPALPVGQLLYLAVKAAHSGSCGLKRRDFSVQREKVARVQSF